MVSSLVGWCVVTGLVLPVWSSSVAADNNVLDSDPVLSADSDDHLLRQLQRSAQSLEMRLPIRAGAVMQKFNLCSGLTDTVAQRPRDRAFKRAQFSLLVERGWKAVHLGSCHLLADLPPHWFWFKTVVLKRCHPKLSSACLKLSLLRTVEMMSKDSAFFLVPGVYFSTNSSDAPHMPPELVRSLSSDHAPLDDLVAFSLRKYLQSLTLNVNLADFVTGGNKTIQNTAIDSVTGRKKEGMGGYGAVAAMMGGMMATVMMAALAALSGKALLVSMAAMMMAVFAAMKGGGGGGESKTYEVISKPIVSHINTHSSEVQHEHHGHYHKRSVGQGGGEMPMMRPSPLVRGRDVSRQRALEDRYGWERTAPGEPRLVANQESISDTVLHGRPRQGLRELKSYSDDQYLRTLGFFR